MNGAGRLNKTQYFDVLECQRSDKPPDEIYGGELHFVSIFV